MLRPSFANGHLGLTELYVELPGLSTRLDIISPVSRFYDSGQGNEGEDRIRGSGPPALEQPGGLGEVRAPAPVYHPGSSGFPPWGSHLLFGENESERDQTLEVCSSWQLDKQRQRYNAIDYVSLGSISGPILFTIAARAAWRSAGAVGRLACSRLRSVSAPLISSSWIPASSYW